MSVAQQRYWTEFEPIKHQFLIVFTKDFENQVLFLFSENSNKIRKELQRKLPDTISFKGPSGHVWPVTLHRGGDRWVLEGGWSDFVRNHGLTEPHFLVFQYDGNHVFQVTIFDTSACEKEDCYFIKNQTGAAENAIKKGKRKLEAGESSRGPSDCSLKKKKYSMYLLSHRRSVSEEEKWRARELADAHAQSSSLPSFTKVMMPTQVRHQFSVIFPKGWGRNLVPKVKNMKVELKVPQHERKWPVTLKNHEWKYGLSKGWYRFMQDNNLEEDDVCVFELNRGGKKRNDKQSIIFDVYIFRVVDEVVPLTAVSGSAI